MGKIYSFRMFHNIPGLYARDSRRITSCNNQKFLWSLPNILWSGAKLLPTENHCHNRSGKKQTLIKDKISKGIGHRVEHFGAVELEEDKNLGYGDVELLYSQI